MYRITNTTHNDLNTVLRLFDQAMALQGKNGYKVWEGIDRVALEKDIEAGYQFKIVRGDHILCVFSIQLYDPHIWGSRDQHDAIYLHRIVVNPDFKGQKQFQNVLDWAKTFAKNNNLKYVRMDTWADNHQLITYYKSFGFNYIKEVKTSNADDLPQQNRNLKVALLEMAVVDTLYE